MRYKRYGTLDQVGVKLGRKLNPGMSAIFVLLSREDRIDKVLPGKEPTTSEDIKDVEDRECVIDRGDDGDQGHRDLRGVSRCWEGKSLHLRG